MLIKEYRIPLPLRVEEYRIAQLYMIQKKSREESEGEGSAVEFLENRPYTDGPNGSGQYTYKVYHIGRHIPSWFRGLVPKTALEVHEESWNAYPYTKTKFSVPFVEKFSMEVETYFQADTGGQNNIFNLKGSELRQREVDVIDMVNDQLSGGDYKEEEDPRLFISQKTGRGPLGENWMEDPPDGAIMCAYKLIKVEFRYWGLQSKVERFIHDYGLRRVMLRAHRQAWAWQDEWVGLTMEDIRRLERETQLILQRKLGRLPPDVEGEEEGLVTDTEGTVAVNSLEVSVVEEGVRMEEGVMEGVEEQVKKEEVEKEEGRVEHVKVKPQPSAEGGGRLWERKLSSRLMKRGRGSIHSVRSVRSVRVEGEGAETLQLRRDSDNESVYSFRAECGLDQIALLSECESDQEFFDAKETVSEDEGSDSEYEEALEGGGSERWKDDSSVSYDDSIQEPSEDGVQDPSSSSVAILLLVIHGGSTLDSRADAVGKNIDFQTLSDNLRNVMELHFHSGIGRVALRMVPCPNVCNSALQLVVNLSPYPVSKHDCGVGLLPTLASSTPSHAPSPTPSQYSIPVGVLPLLAAGSHGYPALLRSVTTAANKVYRQFLSSEEGRNFNGQVCLLTDCMGSVVAYDILSSSRSHPPSPSPPPPSRQHTTSLCDQQPAAETLPYRRGGHYSSATSLTSTSSATIIPPSPSVFDTEQSSSLQFEVSQFFAIGSPLGLVLASRREQAKHTAKAPPPRPQCAAFYNLFYGLDVLAARVEPLLDDRFSRIPPVPIPSYHHYPRGNVAVSSLRETVANQPYLFGSQSLPVPWLQGSLCRKKSISSESLPTQASSFARETARSFSNAGPYTPSTNIKPFSVWWGERRIDYLLEPPHGSESLDLLPPTAFAHIIHSRYWEAREVCSFILRRVLQPQEVCVSRGGQERREFVPPDSTIKWNRKRTSMKIQRLSSNHRANDVLAVVSGHAPTLQGKFQYGPLDMASLSREMVGVYILGLSSRPDWQLLTELTTDSSGRVSHTLSEVQAPPPGLYPVRFLVRGDHTMASCNLFMVPPHTEAVVFSVDGALASNFSIMGKDIRAKPGAVDVARCWQRQGYMIIYITGRPLWQKDAVQQFLELNSFPLGLISCAESLSTDAHLKTIYLARLIKEAKMIIRAAYGSQRHLGIYRELGLQSDQIYIHGRKSRKHSGSHRDCQYLTEGFASHLSELHSSPPRPAMVNMKTLLGTSDFFPGQLKSPAKRKHSRTSSHATTPDTRRRIETTV